MPRPKPDPANGMVRVSEETRGGEPRWVVIVQMERGGEAWVSEFPMDEKHSALNVAGWLESAIRFAVERDRKTRRRP